MSDPIKHECGIAMIRLLKPLEYYEQKYGTSFYGLKKLQLLMYKQRNRGQDGAGVATIKLNTKAGERYISRRRSNSANYLKDLFDGIFSNFTSLSQEQLHDPQWLKNTKPYMGELLLGHLRYGTHGNNSVESCHPFLRQNNWISRNLVLAGNFNMTNVEELFEELIELGQYPKEKTDTVTIMEKIGHFLDDEVQRVFDWFKTDGYSNIKINELIVQHLDIQRILTRASKKFDGGYVIAGMIGHGDSFVMRDPNGIRPAFYYQDEEVVVVASERPAIQTVFNVPFSSIGEIKPGHALIIRENGKVDELPFASPAPVKACSFERIYFSRGSDKEIYVERKKLGELLAKPALEAVNYDFKHTVFSFIPNTAEFAFYGLIEGLEKELNKVKLDKISKLGDKPDTRKLKEILGMNIRAEKLILKDEKSRTFIADETTRGGMVSHVYDITYGLVENEVDTLVLIDDSIVRGTTLRDSLISIAARLIPKKIIILSSAPQIRYPDCYGIDMSVMGEFVAFSAMAELLKENGKEHLLDEVYEKCKAQQGRPKEEVKNYVSELYSHFSYEEVTKKITEIITPKGIKPEIEIIFQTLDNLHTACPKNLGDWYFSGDYPTPGGNKVVNNAFINYMEKQNVRAYL